MENKTLKEFGTAERERLDKEKKQRIEDAGYAPFFVIKDGESAVLEFVDTPPRQTEGKYGTKMVFSIKDANGIAFDYSVNPRAPLYREIVANIAENRYKLQITRVGEGMETQYSVKAVV
jgi:hypothetical protein